MDAVAWPAIGWLPGIPQWSHGVESLAGRFPELSVRALHALWRLGGPRSLIEIREEIHQHLRQFTALAQSTLMPPGHLRNGLMVLEDRGFAVQSVVAAAGDSVSQFARMRWTYVRGATFVAQHVKIT